MNKEINEFDLDFIDQPTEVGTDYDIDGNLVDEYPSNADADADILVDRYPKMNESASDAKAELLRNLDSFTESIDDEEMITCNWCGEEVPASECREEVDLGPICSHCQEAIKSRGEELIFREDCEDCDDKYVLDESVDLEDDDKLFIGGKDELATPEEIDSRITTALDEADAGETQDEIEAKAGELYTRMRGLSYSLFNGKGRNDLTTVLLYLGFVSEIYADLYKVNAEEAKELLDICNSIVDSITDSKRAIDLEMDKINKINREKRSKK